MNVSSFGYADFRWHDVNDSGGLSCAAGTTVINSAGIEDQEPGYTGLGKTKVFIGGCGAARLFAPADTTT
jgi:hypothetical protein